MFPRMKRLLVLALFAAACRPSDGGSQTSPAGSAAASDSARVDSLLQRADLGRIQGDSAAPVWLVEISDFQCPYCKRFHDDVYPALKRDYIDKGIVRMAYVHLPLPSIHPHAELAAEASLCAAAQNRFWPMHDKLFATQERWAGMQTTRAYFDSLAVASGVDTTMYASCMQSGVMRRIINGDGARATNVGARSTPVFFVGDEPIEGLAPLSVYREAIERQRAKAQRPPG